MLAQFVYGGMVIADDLIDDLKRALKAAEKAA